MLPGMAEDLDKERILAALRERLRGQLERVEASQHATQTGAVHSETRQENPKDTRAIEAGYLARGLAERVESLRQDLATLTGLSLAPFETSQGLAVTQLALLEPADEPDTRAVFLLPVGGGVEVEWDGLRVTALSPRSPLGRALLGRGPDDEVELATPRGRQCFRVISAH